MADEIMKELIDITALSRTCKLNLTAMCIETGPSTLFKHKKVCIPCSKQRIINSWKEWRKRYPAPPREKKIKQPREKKIKIPKEKKIKPPKEMKSKIKPTQPKFKSRRSMHMVVQLDPIKCDEISPVVRFD